jgi:hypothetical protein
LLDSSSYPNAQEFNEHRPAELNKIVEEQVLPAFRRAATVGRRVKFAGCVEVADEEADLKPLKLVRCPSRVSDLRTYSSHGIRRLA